MDAQPAIDRAIEVEAGSTRSGGRWLLVARVGWFALVCVTLLLDAYAIPLVYAQLMLPCPTSFCDNWQLTDAQIVAWHASGFPIDAWAGYVVGLITVSTVVYAIVGILIFWRKSSDWMALLASLALVMFGGAAYNGTMQNLPTIDSGWFGPVYALNVFGQIAFFTLFCLFPGGRFVPGWMRWVALLWALFWVGGFFPQLDVVTSAVSQGPLILLFVAALLFAQLYRYQRVSTQVQRQQTKWVVYGFSVAGGGFLVIIAASNLLLASASSDPFTLLVVTTTLHAFLLLIPISIGIAVLRSRLWDIDLIINRTLVYVPLTGILAGIYSASIALLQKLFIAVTGQQSDAAVVLTTLFLAATFTPIKNALQALVDRRFKDAQDPTKQLKAFGQEIDKRMYPVERQAIARRLLNEATTAFTTGGALFLPTTQDNCPTIALTTDGWQDAEAQLTIPLQAGGTVLGKLLLGHRQAGRAYTRKETDQLQQVANQVAAAITE